MKSVKELIRNDLVFPNVIYAVAVFSLIQPVITNVLMGKTIEFARILAAIWAVQAAMYFNQNRRLIKENAMLLINRLETEQSTALTNSINKLLLDKMSQISPDILREKGISIKKKVV